MSKGAGEKTGGKRRKKKKIKSFLVATNIDTRMGGGSDRQFFT